MIETIFSNEKLESDRASKAQPSFKMPKNIRQIGRSNTNKKIYIEDYVMSYIRQLAGGEFAGCSIAVLVGQCIKLENCRNIFISGAVKVKDPASEEENIFTNETWTEIYDDIKKYFVENEIVGWFIGGAGYLMSDEDKIQKIHVDNFAGQDKVLLTYDSLEKEEAFLSYENNRLCKQEGYYIYYERNDEMQSYIIDHRTEESSDEGYEDKVSKDIRTVIQNKQVAKEDNKSVTRLMYAAGTLLAIIVLIIGTAMLRNYDQMKSMQDTLNYLSKNMEEVQANFTSNDASDTSDTSDTTDISDEDKSLVTPVVPEDKTGKEEDSLDVEVVPGNVEPLSDKTSQNQDAESKNNSKEGTAPDKELAADTDAGKDTSLAEPEKTTDSTDGKEQAKNEISYYTVKTGDTLADISFKLYSTYTKVKKIMELNGITDQDLIYVGQKLIVP